MRNNKITLNKSNHISYNFFFLILLILTILSCSKKGTILPDQELSLQNQVKNKDKNSFWTEELEGDILTKDISASQYMSNNVQVTMELINILQNLKPKQYPQLEQMGSLDLSEVDEKLIRLIKNASNSIKTNPAKGLDSLFSKEYVFNYVLFFDDLKNQWKTRFNTKIPEKKLFTKYYIFKPEESFDLIQVPVRFINNNGFVDIKLVIGNNEKTYSIKQIEIIQWGITNGE